MAWAIEHALQSGVFERVFVSTDSERYAEIARNNGAWVPFLRDFGADDFTSVQQILVHELDRVEQVLGNKVDSFGVLQATCPMLEPSTIRSVYDEFAHGEFKTMASCFPFSHANPWWAFSLNGREAEFVMSEPGRSRSQDRPTLYCPSGAIGFADAALYRDDPSFYGPGHGFYPISWREGLDIDEPDDLEMCGLLMAQRLAGT